MSAVSDLRSRALGYATGAVAEFPDISFWDLVEAMEYEYAHHFVDMSISVFNREIEEAARSAFALAGLHPGCKEFDGDVETENGGAA